MDELHTLHPNGLFLRREALEHGYGDRDLHRARAASRLAHVRHGAYVSAPTWIAADDLERHKLACQAVLLTHGHRVALSHTSAAVMHGLRLWQPDLSHVHVIRLDGQSGRRHAGVVYHRDDWQAELIYNLDEMLLVDPITSALGAASLTGIEAGLTVVDSLFDLDLGSPDDVAAAYSRRGRWPGSLRLQIVVRLARPGAQSVAESRTRFLFWVHHVPEPVLQYRVLDEYGQLVGITDFAWPERKMLGEFDGKLKFGRALRPDQNPSDVLFEEKKREDRLREVTGFGMIRYVYADLYKPAATAARTMRKLNSPFAA